MMLLNGVNHVAILTSDTDRLVAFYRQVFDAEIGAHRRGERRKQKKDKEKV